MLHKKVAQFLYSLTGVIFTIVGVAVPLYQTGLLPDSAKNIALNVAKGDLNALHLLQEFSSLLVFAGLMCFWAIKHYEQSKFFHWSLTTFFALLAFAHWFDVRGNKPSITGPMVNSVPFLLYLVVGLLRQNND